MSTLAHSPVLPVYARQDLTFVRGEGTTLYDADGRAYLDFLAGIAVVGLGHCHPAPLATKPFAAVTLIGRPLADERGKGRKGKPGGFPLVSPQRARRRSPRCGC